MFGHLSISSAHQVPVAYVDCTGSGRRGIAQGCTPLSTTGVTCGPRDVVRVPRKPLWRDGVVMVVGVLGEGCLEAVAG